MKIENTDNSVEPAASAVENSGLPRPEVRVVDESLVMAVKLCTESAIPPPAITAKDHLSSGLISATTDAIRILPAMNAAGADTVSSKLSRTGM